MTKYLAWLMPLAAVLAGCAQPAVETDEEFLESIQSAAETAPPPDYKSPTMLIDASGPLPDIEVETDHFILGTIPNDRPGQGVVKIRNRGEATLEIKNVTTSCHCTVGSVEQRLVEPGEEVDMIVTVDPALIPGFEATRVLTIESNDPDMPAYPVAVTTYVSPEVLLVPESGNLGAIMAGKGLERNFILRQLQSEPFEVLAARPTHHFMKVAYRERPEDQWLAPDHREYDIILTVQPDAPVGRLDSKISLETSLKRTRRLQYELSGVVHANPYNMIPRTAVFSGVTPGATIPGVFALTAEGSIVVESTRADGDALRLVASQPNGTNEVLFDVVVGAEAKAGRVQQIWDIGFDIAGTDYAEQLMVVLNLPAAVSESE